MDVCLSKPCKNGGFCVSSVGSYQCWCPSGFRGMFRMPAVVGSSFKVWLTFSVRPSFFAKGGIHFY